MRKKLTFEIHHKDGNRKNNKRENVELLCPNCHSLTKYWRKSWKSKRACGEIGKRTGLRPQRPSRLGGSNPLMPTLIS